VFLHCCSHIRSEYTSKYKMKSAVLQCYCYMYGRGTTVDDHLFADFLFRTLPRENMAISSECHVISLVVKWPSRHLAYLLRYAIHFSPTLDEYTTT
jgi:hypothetical protein